jgi:S1-C subfamily serine protease
MGMLIMRCATNWVLLAAAFCLAGCQPAASNGTAKLSSDTPSEFVTQLESLDIDTANVVPISKPLNLSMQPMQAVSFTQVESTLGSLDTKVIMKGRIWFSRVQDGKIEQHKEVTSALLQFKKKNVSIDLQMTGSEVSIFEPNGKVWSITPVELHAPTAAPAGLTQQGWDSIRAELIPDKPHQGLDQILSCAGWTFTFAKGSFQTGTPVYPRTRREFFDQLADCVIAASRGDPEQTDSAGYSFRYDIMHARSESELAEIHDRARNSYEKRWEKNVAEFSSDVTVRGMVVKDGQEFAYADGRATIGDADGKRMVVRQQALIDPYSGLPYQTVSTAETSGPSSDTELAAYNGKIVSTVIDLPSRTPANVTLAEPRKPVTSPTGAGSVVEIYNRSIDAIYEVQTPNGTGTAFAISGRQALTAAHVVEGSKTVTLISASGTQMMATVVKRDTQRDVALLELAGAQFPDSLNLSRDFAVTGAQVIVIGCPLGACGSVTTGIVSFSARRLQGVAMVQIDAQINPGNSGGPILNTNGDVIGIVEEKYNPNPKFDGLSFGLASPEIAQFLGS